MSCANPTWRSTIASSALSTRSRCLTRSASIWSRTSRTDRPALQRLGRNPHRGLEEIDRGVAPERLIQPLAEADPGRRGVAHRGADQFIAAEFEEAAMADPLPRRPVENARRVVLGDPAAQQLARLVPVDQEHQRRAERGEEGVAIRGAVGLILSGDEKEGVVFAEARRDMAIEPAPFRLELARTGAMKNLARARCTSV